MVAIAPGQCHASGVYRWPMYEAANARRYRETRAGIELVDVESATTILAATFMGLEPITDETSPPP